MSTTTLQKTNGKLSMLALAAISALAFTTCLVLGFAATPAHAASVSYGKTFTKAGITYKITDLDRDDREGELRLVKYASAKKSVHVNTVSYGGYRFDVEEVGSNAFNTKRGHQVTKVTLGDNVDRIGTRAFYGCKKLKTLNLRNCDAIELDRDGGSWYVDDLHVGSKTFSGVNSKVKVQCGRSSASYQAAYKNALVKKGLPRAASVVR